MPIESDDDLVDDSDGDEDFDTAVGNGGDSDDSSHSGSDQEVSR